MNRLESRTRNRKVVSSSLEPAGIVGGGSECSALSPLNTTAEVPLCKAPNPQLLPGCRSINGCPLLWVCVHSVCVHFGWVNAEHEFRVWVTIFGHMGHGHFVPFTILKCTDFPQFHMFLTMVTCLGNILLNTTFGNSTIIILIAEEY